MTPISTQASFIGVIGEIGGWVRQLLHAESLWAAMAGPVKPRFFATPTAFHKWLSANHATKTELVVGFWKVGSGKPSMTWPEAVVEAVAHGWIDGVRHSLDVEAYTIRFTPRKSTSTWSLVNVKTATRLITEGRMTPAGRKAFEARKDHKTGIYSAEQTVVPELAPHEAKTLQADGKAWADFTARPPSYQKAVRWWLASAKKPQTRTRRFQELLSCSRAGKPVPPFTPRPGKAASAGRKRARPSSKSG